MRLLNVDTLRVETFHGSEVPEYAALSHTWGDEEVTFQDLTTDLDHDKKGWIKICRSANEAKRQSCKYIWVDTCCIDKSSSAELSEAINSMFRWYRKSKVCFAHLEDVSIMSEQELTDNKYELRSNTGSTTNLIDQTDFYRSRWFTRGWTLQELIAPKILFFYDSIWNVIGEKRELGKDISVSTGIDIDVLCNYRLLFQRSIARRMSWASKRETTRVEDMAYCLMGVFDVNMPLLYGEGVKAFIRLQAEIMRSSYDHSLFAWDHDFPDTEFGSNLLANKELKEGDSKQFNQLLGVGMLAPHPMAFKNSADIIPHTAREAPYHMTNRGIQIRLRILQSTKDGSHSTHLAILQCGYRDDFGTAIAVPLLQESASKRPELTNEFCRAPNKSLLSVSYTQAGILECQNVYLLKSGPLYLSEVSLPFHRLWLREYGKELGVRFCKGLHSSCADDFSHSYDGFHSWNFKNNSITWNRNWPELRMALYFSKNDELAFVLLLSFRCLSYETKHTTVDFQIRPVTDSTSGPLESVRRKGSLHQILRENINFDHKRWSGDVKKTFAVGKRSMTVQVTQVKVFDEDTFTLDLFFSGFKRERSEIESGRSNTQEDSSRKRRII